MQKSSVFSLIKNAFSNHEKWDLAWKDPTPKKAVSYTHLRAHETS